MDKKRVWALLVAVILFAATAAGAAQIKAPSKGALAKPGTAEKPKQHQATGKVVSFSATSLVIAKTVGKQKSDWSFALTPKTKTQGALAKEAKVTVHYHEEKDKKIADRIKVWEASSSSSKGVADNRKPPKSKS